MKKTGWIPTLILGAVVAALAVGATAYLSTERVSAQVTGHASGLSWMPEGASVVGHMDLTALLNSPMRDRWASEMDKPERQNELEEFRAATGLDPMRDIQSVTFAAMTPPGAAGSGPQAVRPDRFGFAVQGTFDRDRLIATMGKDAELTEESYQGTMLYHRKAQRDDLDHGRDHELSVAFATDDTILVGDREFVQSMLDSGFGRLGSASSAIEQTWGATTFDGATFWIAASPENGFGNMIPSGQELPPIQSLALSGRLDADVALRARGRAADPASATKLADVVRGFVALGSLQQGQNPDLGTILDSITIDQFDNEVDVTMTVPYETLERLSQQGAEAAEPGNE